jgi:hypothetical protein
MVGFIGEVQFGKAVLAESRVAAFPALLRRAAHFQVGKVERAAGIEPASLAWKAKVLPLHNARNISDLVHFL